MWSLARIDLIAPYSSSSIASYVNKLKPYAKILQYILPCARHRYPILID
jgi:hypothetical protein